jgi:hypothetical protein
MRFGNLQESVGGFLHVRNTGGPVTMRSVDGAPNAQVPINHSIANFPLTADGVSQLTGIIQTHYGSLFFKLH